MNAQALFLLLLMFSLIWVSFLSMMLMLLMLEYQEGQASNCHASCIADITILHFGGARRR